MKDRLIWGLCALFVASVLPASATAQTAFTYQGRLNDNGAPATGQFDLRFSLYDAASNGSVVGSPATLAPVSVLNGVFTVTLDFGQGAFPGSGRWLEVAVRDNGSQAAYAVITPRQTLTRAPYAIHANTAQTLSAPISENLLPGSVLLSNADNVFTGATTFSGDFDINLGNTSGNGISLIAASKDGVGGGVAIKGGEGFSAVGGEITIEAGASSAFSGAGVSSDVVLRGGGVETVDSQAELIVGGGKVVQGASGQAHGGVLELKGGAGIGTNRDGGHIILTPGSATGSGLAGKVGIGKTNPGTTLDVNGTVTATSFSGSGSGLTGLDAGALSSGTISSARIPSLNASILTAGTLNASRIASGSITSDKIAAGAVGAAELADGAVTAAKLGSDVGLWSVGGGNVYRASGQVSVGTSSPTSTQAPLTVRAGAGNHIIRMERNNGSPGWEVFSGADGLDFAEANVATGRLHLKPGGNVGIGNDDPGEALDIGNYFGGDKYLRLNATGGNLYRAGLKLRHFDDKNGWNIESDERGASLGLNFVNLADNENGVSAMFIHKGNNVGVGTTDPQAKLHVNGTVLATSFLTAGNTASGANSAVSGGTGNTASGQTSSIGGGEANTATMLDSRVGGGFNNHATGVGAFVGGGHRNTAAGSFGAIPGGGDNAAAGAYSFAAGNKAKANHDGSFVWADTSGGDYASTADRQFLIRAAGGVGIGTASPAAALHVNGSGWFGPDAGSLASSGGKGVRVFHESNGQIFAYDYGANTSEHLVLQGVGGFVAIGSVTPSHLLHVDGVARASQSTFATSSDRRAKRNIEPVEGSLEKLARLRPVNFEYTKEYAAGRAGYEGSLTGFIAQEVETVFPEMVDRVEEKIGGKTVEDFRVLNMGNLTTHLVAGLKELRAEKDREISQLSSAKEALQNENSELKTRLEKLEREHAAREARMAAVEKALGIQLGQNASR